MNASKKLSRRSLLKTAAVITPVAMTGCATLGESAETGEPLVRVDDPVARSLGYHADTNAVPADHPLATNHAVSQSCSNCIHQRGSAGAGRIECPMFPGRSVNTNGWCTLWAQG